MAKQRGLLDRGPPIDAAGTTNGDDRWRPYRGLLWFDQA
jgi:hypothetical protein